MFRRAVGSLLARRFSPRATPRTAPARSLHFLSDLPIGEGLHNATIFAAGMVAGGGGVFAIRNFNTGTGVDESAGMVTWARNHLVKFKKPDMEERFERWIIENNKTYKDEEEKAMRFQLFKASVEMMESMQSQPPSDQELIEVSYLADFTKEEKRMIHPYPDGSDNLEYNQVVKSPCANQEKGATQKMIRSTQLEATGGGGK